MPPTATLNVLSLTDRVGERFGPGTILDLLIHNARQYAQAPALLAPGRPPLSHARLLQQVEQNIAALTNGGIRHGDRIIVVLDNGPEMAVGFLSTAAFSACVPLNPAYKATEFDVAFSALRPNAVIASASSLSLVSEIASRHAAALFEMAPDDQHEAGVCALRCHSPAQLQSCPDQGDIALLLQTSGTTSRPKLVGLTQANLMSSAENIGRSLELGPTDRCLNIMPLFHIHGLVGALLASLRAGSSVICCPGLQTSRFFDWLTEFRPSWYTAVPTMHASIVARATHYQAKPLLPHTLRFIRSCSAALPRGLMQDLEEVFGVPVLEAYGMTEASHQIACNPLPPAERKPGSVGVATGTDITILDELGRHLPPEAEGEIAVHGASLIRGYLESASANAQNFINGWFRTGDIGSIDIDGYLFIRGRLKEFINRGGAKISPYEVEEVLLDHPAVAEAAVFAVPDKRLGENIGAAVVLKVPGRVTAAELRDFLSARLADFKVPQRIAFVGEIPKGPTGKFQRINLAASLEMGPPVSETTAAIDRQPNRLEELLLSLWARALRFERIALDDNFFDLGGDSLCATELLLQMEQVTGLELPIGALFEAPSVRELAKLITGPGAAQLAQRVFSIHGYGSRPPFFCVGAGPLFWPLAKRLGADQPFYGVAGPPEDATLFGSIEEIAAFHVRSIRAVQPEGPYVVGGWCVDGTVAYEIAQQLRAQSQEVALLVLFDALNPGRWEKYLTVFVPILKVYDLIQTGSFHLNSLRCLRINEYMTYIRERFLTLLLRLRRQTSLLRISIDSSFRARLQHEGMSELTHVAALRYRPKPYSGPMVLFRRTLRPVGPGQDQTLGWADVVQAGLTVVNVPGDHRDMFLEPQVGCVAEKLSVLIRGPGRLSGDESALAPRSEWRPHPAGMPVWKLSKIGVIALQLLHWLVPWT